MGAAFSRAALPSFHEATMTEPHKPFSSPESRAAFALVKTFVRTHVAADLVDSIAIRLVFEDDETKRVGMSGAIDEMLAGFADMSATSALAHGVTAAFVEIVRERLDAIEAAERGTA